MKQSQRKVVVAEFISACGEAISGGEESKARLNWAACESYRLGGISFK